MPNYTFRNKKTKKEHTEFMTISERELYLRANPELEQVISLVPIVDSVRIGITKPDAGFQKNVIGRIKAEHPDSYIGNRHFNIPSEI